ncbi:LEAF RUST 10 DISEASE-RESISTANCE LOCUS RECEPTOR-LIKE PROTEIN KINASE-like 2.1 [Hibiscus syriacus]|nr:LEAF RUST 10 DISEASE-RESISTANCE LOCUS RECEPTOR-LIKE PROTEIN KINASE-like 2.1 [Hibiscus syriacus]
MRYFAYEVYCKKCKDSGGSCGSNETVPAAFACYCRDHPRQIHCHHGSGSSLSVKLTIGITGGATSLLITCIITLYFRRKIPCIIISKFTNTDTDIEAFIRNNGTLSPRRYSYSDVVKMTNSFEEQLGKGGYGSVYKGKLVGGHLVAVKVLNTTKGDGQEFINEIASISRTSHVNIVTLLGFCLEDRKRALVYDFMPNGSLERFIYKEDNTMKDRQHLSSEELFEIAIGIARGLEYLHHSCNTRILHFDIKPHNILLDENFRPKIADFGLAKLCTTKESIVSMLEARGTIGYIAPEVFCRSVGAVSHKSDVYSYGMVVLEMVGGRMNVDAGVNQSCEIYFPHWIYGYVVQDNMEPQFLGLETKEETEVARKMILVGLWCIQTNPIDRPPMSRVIKMLEGSVEVLQIPPKPYLSSPSRSPVDSTFLTLSSHMHP